MVTGSAGTGKTAIVGRVVSLSNPAERGRLLAEGKPLGHADPQERSVDAHVHARGLTADRAADVIGEQLVRAGVLAAQQGRRNAAELVGQVQRAAEEGASASVIVVDGLDEARSEAFTMAEELLLRLAPYALLVVSTRELRRGETVPSLLDVLTAGTAELDLDDPVLEDRGRADRRAYIAGRLAGVDPRMDADKVADHLATQVSMPGSGPFLLARLVTDQLRASPVDTSAPGWQEQVSHSIEEAFDADLDTLVPPASEQGGARPAGESARILLSALTWGLGAGLPEEEWLTCANSITPGNGDFSRDDVTWILEQLGRYIIQDGEAGVAVYRVAHQSLADHIRPPFTATGQRLFDTQTQPVIAGLAARYQTLLAGGVPVTAPGYLWRYIWRHAAAAGPTGLDQLRDLAATDQGLLPDVGMATLQVADRYAHWGYWTEALTLTEEAAQIYRELARTNAAFLPDLATSLSNLGVRYGELGRRQDALAPAEEAVQIRRELARTNAAFLPDLASSLNNLGVHYGELGRRQDALAPTEEAVQIRRELARTNAAFLPDLATTLINLGNRYSYLGRRQDALAPAEESVQIYRELAPTNAAFLPDLAMSLNNLGVHYSYLGRRQDALAPTEEAVQIRRELARTNAAFLPDLATTLVNLGACYSDLGRRQDALAPAEEAVQIYRELAPTNAAFLPDLAMSLNNLGVHYSYLGRRQDALAPTEEAVQIRRELARTNVAFLPNLASSLNNLGNRYGDLGRRQDALAPTEEAVQIYRELAPTNPAFLPDLAMTLVNLGACYSDLGRRQDALASTEEAVQIYRELARTNAAFLPDLASSLNNLGNRYGELGRPQDALAPAEEAVQIRRELARTNAAFLPDLASSLNNLGVRYGELGRRQDALAPAEEAVQIYRELARTNAAFLPDLASSLNNLGNRYGELGRRQDALAPAEESVQIYRELAPTNAAFLPDLAMSLNNLGVHYSYLGRRQDALAPAEEAVQIRRELARTNAAFLPNLATSLNNLSDRYSELGFPEKAEAAWAETIGAAEPAGAAFLLIIRAGQAAAGHAQAAAWLAQALRLDSDDPAVAAEVHKQARRHRAADPASFDELWQQHTGAAVPAWLTVDPQLLDTARAWIGTDTYEGERDYLAAHPELLEPAADVAVADTLLTVSEPAARLYTALRQAAQQDGVEAAYRPLLLGILAREFAAADAAEQRALLANRREDLLTNTVADTLTELADSEDDQAAAGLRAAALLTIERDSPAGAGPVLEALTEPGRFPGLLHALATDSPALVGPAALVAYTTAATNPQAATALFYYAIGTAIAGDPKQAAETITEARALDPDQGPVWINLLAGIGQQHGSVLALIPGLTAPPAPSTPSSSAKDDADAAH